MHTHGPNHHSKLVYPRVLQVLIRWDKAALGPGASLVRRLRDTWGQGDHQHVLRLAGITDHHLLEAAGTFDMAVAKHGRTQAILDSWPCGLTTITPARAYSYASYTLGFATQARGGPLPNQVPQGPPLGTIPHLCAKATATPKAAAGPPAPGHQARAASAQRPLQPQPSRPTPASLTTEQACAYYAALTRAIAPHASSNKRSHSDDAAAAHSAKVLASRPKHPAAGPRGHSRPHRTSGPGTTRAASARPGDPPRPDVNPGQGRDPSSRPPRQGSPAAPVAFDLVSDDMAAEEADTDASQAEDPQSDHEGLDRYEYMQIDSTERAFHCSPWYVRTYGDVACAPGWPLYATPTTEAPHGGEFFAWGTTVKGYNAKAPGYEQWALFNADGQHLWAYKTATAPDGRTGAGLIDLTDPDRNADLWPEDLAEMAVPPAQALQHAPVNWTPAQAPWRIHCRDDNPVAGHWTCPRADCPFVLCPFCARRLQRYQSYGRPGHELLPWCTVCPPTRRDYLQWSISSKTGLMDHWR